MFSECPAQRFDDILAHVACQGGDRRFRPQDQVAVEVFHAVADIEVERRQEHLGQPLLVLRDIALQQADSTCLAVGRGPGPALQQVTGSPNQNNGQGQYQDRQGACLDQSGQRGSRQGDKQRQQEHATDRRIPGQPAVDLRVAEREPGKAGQEPAANPFHHDQQHGKQNQPRTFLFFGCEPDGQPGCEAVVECEPQCQQHGQRDGQCPGHARIHTHAVLDPEKPGTQETGTEQPARQEGASRCRVEQQVEEQGERDRRQPPEAGRSESERGQDASQECRQQLFHSSPVSGSRRTASRRILRLSARMTRNSKRSITTVSPLFGK